MEELKDSPRDSQSVSSRDSPRDCTRPHCDPIDFPNGRNRHYYEDKLDELR